MRRLSAFAIGTMALIALGMQFWLNGDTPGMEPWGARAWDMLRYFTILTNGLVAVVMLREAAERPVGPHWHATAALNITMVGIIYQILLAPPEPLVGLDWWPDALFHAFVPAAALGWWLALAPKSTRFADLPRWLAWPLAYCLYILVRAEFDGKYPYFFLDIPRFGVAIVARNIVGLVAVFAVFGALMVLAGRLSRR